MATLKIPDEGRTITDAGQIADWLSGAGIDYERWAVDRPLAEDASADEVLRAYAEEVERMKASGGYVTADVIDVTSRTPNLDAMLARFSREHWHDEDEVRFIVRGRGVFHIHSREGPVFALEVEPGDLVRVPRGTWHWFDLCAERRIRAIRLFQDAAGWTPHYTGSGIDQGYEPQCFGPARPPEPHESSTP